MTQPTIVFARKLHLLLALLTCAAMVACGGDPSDDGAASNSEEVVDQTPGIQHADGEVIFRTEPFTIAPGDERFACYTQTLQEDLVVDGYSTPGKSFVHHLIFAKTSGDEPEGWSDCDVLFRFVWEPIFAAGTGTSETQFPEGVGHVLPAGTRLLAQLHLLNAGTEPVTDSTEIHMHPSTVENPEPISLYAFGNFDVSLPPLQPGKVESVCTVSETIHFVGVIPHMHMLGRSLTFDVGPSEDQLTRVFERNPYNFDDQHIELSNLTLNPGDVTRVTCNYENTTDRTITFGESTTDEMCFFAGFATGRGGQGGCVTGTFPSDLFSEPSMP